MCLNNLNALLSQWIQVWLRLAADCPKRPGMAVLLSRECVHKMVQLTCLAQVRYCTLLQPSRNCNFKIVDRCAEWYLDDFRCMYIRALDPATGRCYAASYATGASGASFCGQSATISKLPLVELDLWHVLTVGFLPFVYFWVLRFPSPVPLAGKGQVENNHCFDTGVSSHAGRVQVAAPWVQSWQPPRVAPCYCLSTNGKPSPIGATPSHAAKLRRIDVTKGGLFFIVVL